MNAWLSTDGQVFALPIDDSRPHAHSILEAIYEMGVLFGENPEVRAAAIEIVSQTGIRDGDVHSAVDAIALWVQQAMRWIPDPHGTERVESPLVLLQTIAERGRAYGDCDDHVILFVALVRAIGPDARPVGVQLGTDPFDPTRFDHVIASVPMPDGTSKDYDLCAKFWPAGHYVERLVIAWSN